MKSPEFSMPFFKIVSKLGLSILALSSIATACKSAVATQEMKTPSATLSEIIANPCAFVNQKVITAAYLQHIGSDLYYTYGFALDLTTGQIKPGLNSTRVITYQLYTDRSLTSSSLTAFEEKDSSLRIAGVPLSVKGDMYQDQVIVQGKIEKVQSNGKDQCALELTQVEKQSDPN